MDEILPGVVDATSTPLHLMPFSAHTGPRRYRKRPVVVDAVQMNSRFQVRSVEGVMSGSPGDYLLIGSEGERFPCARSVFEASYEEAPDEPTEPAPESEPEKEGAGDSA